MSTLIFAIISLSLSDLLHLAANLSNPNHTPIEKTSHEKYFFTKYLTCSDLLPTFIPFTLIHIAVPLYTVFFGTNFKPWFFYPYLSHRPKVITVKAISHDETDVQLTIGFRKGKSKLVFSLNSINIILSCVILDFSFFFLVLKVPWCDLVRQSLEIAYLWRVTLFSWETRCALLQCVTCGWKPFHYGRPAKTYCGSRRVEGSSIKEMTVIIHNETKRIKFVRWDIEWQEDIITTSWVL